ncbi:MAG: cytidylate kinase-like family protein [bacterium]|nr:cytidylate kinase-like family protein [bacterium]
MSLLLTERLIQRQINHWNRLREFLRDDAEEVPENRGPVVTVSRLAGSGGRQLAETLAARLELELQDRSLIEGILRDRRIHESVVARLDERTASQVRLWVQGLLQRRILLRDEFHTALVEAVTALAAQGSVVFLGRGANVILGEHADLRVRVVAGRKTRLRNLAERFGLDEDAAAANLRETDEQRSDFVRKVFGKEAWQPEDYDLVFNADRLEVEEMVDHVVLVLSRVPAQNALAAEA